MAHQALNLNSYERHTLCMLIHKYSFRLEKIFFIEIIRMLLNYNRRGDNNMSTKSRLKITINIVHLRNDTLHNITIICK